MKRRFRVIVLVDGKEKFNRTYNKPETVSDVIIDYFEMFNLPVNYDYFKDLNVEIVLTDYICETSRVYYPFGGYRRNLKEG